MITVAAIRMEQFGVQFYQASLTARDVGKLVRFEVLSYGEKTLGYPRSVMLRGVMIASLLGLFTIPLWSHISDRIGRRPVYLAGGIASLLVAFPFFWLVERGPGFVILAMILAMNFGHDMMYGPMAAILAELFGTHVRYSGASVVYQLASVVSGGVAPFIATVLGPRVNGT